LLATCQSRGLLVPVDRTMILKSMRICVRKYAHLQEARAHFLPVSFIDLIDQLLGLRECRIGPTDGSRYVGPGVFRPDSVEHGQRIGRRQ